ncbi:hypothetical protein ScPMuIL_007022 [Solemya velum]
MDNRAIWANIAPYMASSGPRAPPHPPFTRPQAHHRQVYNTVSGEQARQAALFSVNRDKEYLARVQWLLIDAGTSALKATFDSVHTPLNLRHELNQTHVKTLLNRLLRNSILDDNQFEMLYPPKKKASSSQKYDSRTLITLLQSICHLCPPYPNGWSALPLSTDSSLSADIVRIQLLYQQVASKEGLSWDEFSMFWRQIKEVLLRLGGPPVRVKIHRIEHEVLPADMQQHYIRKYREIWDGNDRPLNGKDHHAAKQKTRRKMSKHKAEEKEGLPPEDKATLTQTYKLLVDTVVADDVIDRMQQSQVVKFGDRQEILALAKNSERMQLLLDKILHTKLQFGFKAFCDAIKFKYKDTYDKVTQIRKAIYKQGVPDSIDVMGLCQEVLIAHYKTQFAKCHPFPWNETLNVAIRDMYTPVDILDVDGRKLHLSDLLPPTDKGNRGSRVLLEGLAGSGKSTLNGMIAYTWATQRNYFRAKYPLLLLVDAEDLEGESLAQAIHTQLLPENFKIGPEEFWSMLEAHAQDTVIFIDGYSNGVSNHELKQLLAGTSLRNATIVVSANPELLSSSTFTPDMKFFNMGFSSSHIKRFIKTCIALSRSDPEEYESLLEHVTDASWELRPHLAQPYFCLQLFIVYQTLKGINVRDIVTVTDLLEKSAVAMAAVFCKRQKLDIIGEELPDEIVHAVAKLEEFAFKMHLENKKTFTDDDVIRETQNSIAFKLGAFVKFFTNTKYKYTCSLQHDFLCAKHLSDMVLEDMSKIIENNGMMKQSRFKQVISMICGLFRTDCDTQVIKTLFTELCARNFRFTRGVSDGRQPFDTSSTKSQTPSGHITDFSHSLQSLSECPNREDVLEMMSESFPARVVLRRDGLVPIKCVQGLSQIMAFDGNKISELDINLRPIYAHQHVLYLSLAKATSSSKNLKILKVSWSSLDLMASFLNSVVEGSESLETIFLSDVSKKPIKQVSAETWAGLQDACQNMTRIKSLTILNGKVAAVIYHVIHHLPDTINELNFTGCNMNLMCACELSGKLERAQALERLDLSSAKLDSTEFVAILQGLKLCDTIKFLKLAGARLDRPGVNTLAECLRLTSSLECLDLSDCSLTTEMCKRLAGAIVQNHSLRKLVMKNVTVSCEGKLIISHTKINQIRVVGLDEVPALVPILV